MFTLVFSCARKGRPEGGPKDEEAPIMVTANPPYKTINFDKKSVKIYFNEYVVLKDLMKQLIVSPPLKTPLVINPQGTPSKHFTIKILDTLKSNTTYTFNFGNAIQDNNEGNKLESFKYVFSTGTSIDSLNIKGEVTHSFNKEKEKNISVLLYKVNDSFNDSIIYKFKPEYVTSTLDSTKFNFSNVKEGKYFMIALKETTNDYLYNPKTDEIGFLNDTLTLPKDSIVIEKLRLFKEKKPFKLKRAKELFKGKIQFGFEGERKGVEIELLSKTIPSYKGFYKYEKEKDTLLYWHTPLEVDSLNFLVKKDEVIDKVTVRLRKKKIDSLKITSNISSILHPRDTFFLETNNPIKSIDSTKIHLTDKDTVQIPFNLKKIDINKLAVLFKSKDNWGYSLKLLPNAINDLYEVKNDTLNYQFNTKDVEDYGSIVLDVRNKSQKSLILQLLRQNKIFLEKKVKLSQEIKFTSLEPEEYTVRVIIDENNNGYWDTGDYLKRLQPEKVIYMPQEFKLRANWVQNEILEIE